MSHQRQFFILLALILAIVVGYSLVRSKSDMGVGEPIRIGFIGPLTGGPALWGEGAKHMAELAAEEVNNAGGINKRSLEIIYEDGKCTPKDAVTAMQKLQNQGIKFVIGGHCSPETAGMAPLTKDGNMFMIAGITSSDNIVSDSYYAYRTSPSTYEFTDKLTGIALDERQYRTIATLTESAAFSKSFTEDLRKDYEKTGGIIVFAEEYLTTATDFRSMILKIKEKRPDALFLSPQNPLTGINILKQMKELDVRIPIFSTSVLVNEANFTKSDNSDLMKGMFAVIPYTDTQTKKALELTRKYKEKFGGDVPYNYFYVSATYDAVNMLAQALAKCGEQVQCVADYFENINYEGVSLTYRFKENGDPYFNSWAKLSLDENGKEIIEVLK